MNFELTDDQRAIQRTARDFLADAYPPAEVRRLAYETPRGFTDEGWASICTHVHAADFPETASGWHALGAEAGFGRVREVYAMPADLFRMYVFAS